MHQMIMSRASQLTHSFRPNQLQSISCYPRSRFCSIHSSSFPTAQLQPLHINHHCTLHPHPHQHQHLNTLSNHLHISRRHCSSSSSDRGGVSGTPIKKKIKKKVSKDGASTSSSSSSSSSSSASTSSAHPNVLHSKTTTKTIQSSTRTRLSGTGTETVQKKTISRNTQIHSGEHGVNVTYSQQIDKHIETNGDDASKDKSTVKSQMYKRMDIHSAEGVDSHTVINSSQEHLSAMDSAELDALSNRTRSFDLYAVGNPSSAEIERRKAMRSPDALIIHPDRLLPVVQGAGAQESEQRGWGYYKRRFSQTFTSIRERIIGNEKYNDYKQKVTESTESLADAYDTSQNYHVTRIRSMIDRLNMQTESSKAMQIVQEEFGDFWVEDFLPEFDAAFSPLIVRAFFNDDLEFLNTICVGEAAIYCKNIIEGRIAENKMLAPDILWIHEADLVETKLHNKTPQLVVRVDVQSVDCVYERGSEKVVEGSPGKVASTVFLMILEPNIEADYNKVAPLPWQLRSIQTARQKQLV